MNTNGVTPPPGCKVRGCCMGIPIGCGTLAALALLLTGAFTAGRSVQARQDGREGAERLRVGVEGPARVRGQV